MERIEEKAQDVDRLFSLFRQMQTKQGMEAGDFVEAKQELRNRLKELEDELDRYLAGEYGIDQNNIPKAREYDERFKNWRQSHKPFHWFVEFYGILKNSGFDVIIGNPPYVEYSKVRCYYFIKNYMTEACGNLYAFVMERNNTLLSRHGRTGMIVPHSAFCTDRMEKVIDIVSKGVTSWISTYSIRPSKLFIGADQRLAIYLLSFNSPGNKYSTCYHRWHEEFRPCLFDLLQYEIINSFVYKNSLSKAESLIEESVWQKIHNHRVLAIDFSGSITVYYHNTPRYWIRAMTSAPYFWNERNGEQISSHVKSLYLTDKADASIVVAVLNSSLFYWWFILLSNCRDLNMREIERFPLGLEQMNKERKDVLVNLCDLLMIDYIKHTTRKECEYKATGKVIYDEFQPRYSKPIIDEIDRVLAKHYGFTDKELDFIINYDIKYRMGLGAGEGEEE